MTAKTIVQAAALFTAGIALLTVRAEVERYSDRVAAQTTAAIEVDEARGAVIDAILAVAPAPTAPPVVRPHVHVHPAVMSGDVAEAIAAAWGDPATASRAVRIAYCESTFNPRSLSPATRFHKAGAYRGLFQMGPNEWQDTGGTGDPINASVTEQTRRAYMLWQARGFQPWVCKGL